MSLDIPSLVLLVCLSFDISASSTHLVFTCLGRNQYFIIDFGFFFCCFIRKFLSRLYRKCLCVFVNCFTCQGNAATFMWEHRDCAKIVPSKRDKGLEIKSRVCLRWGGLKTLVDVVTVCPCAGKKNNNKENVTLFGCVCR